MIRRLLVPALAVVLALVSVAAAQAEDGEDQAALGGFVLGLEDLPLMPGLSRIEDASLAFDSPAGRIVVSYAQGEVGRSDVLAFYAATLPQLGWEPVARDTYRREDETLRLEFVEAGASLTVRFYLAPS